MVTFVQWTFIAKADFLTFYLQRSTQTIVSDIIQNQGRIYQPPLEFYGLRLLWIISMVITQQPGNLKEVKSRILENASNLPKAKLFRLIWNSENSWFNYKKKKKIFLYFNSVLSLRLGLLCLICMPNETDVRRFFSHQMKLFW